jgi:hypothetical protein
MTISYAPLEDPENEYRLVPRKNTEPKKEQSECNTLVMIFVGSVLFLALMDSMSNK